MVQALVNTVYAQEQTTGQLSLHFRDAGMRITRRPKQVGDMMVFYAADVTPEKMETVSHSVPEGVVAYALPDGEAWAAASGQTVYGATLIQYPPDT